MGCRAVSGCVIKLTRAKDGKEIYVRSIDMIEPAPDEAQASAVITTTGQKIGVRESVADVLKAIKA